MSCADSLVDPKLPPGATQFTPPAVFTTWWEMTKACSGRSGSLDAVTWYEVPTNVPLESDGKPVSAYWSAASNQIVVSAAVARNGQVIRHEMLHALLRTKGHSRADFLERCAGRVTCSLRCIEDAGPAPAVPASVPRVVPSAMQVTVKADPVNQYSSVNDGYFSMIVRVHNPAPNPVFVILPEPSTVGGPVSFSYRLSGLGSEALDLIALDGGVAMFAAGETKEHVFDFFIGNGSLTGHVYTGLYTFSGAYGGHAAPDYSLWVR
ncbi:MAG TPA: hypothetical protein VMO26_02635 [Vicinamibacterales bacterium]|nr:hypothetical protein [Vicinamibacterales bacterium]